MELPVLLLLLSSGCVVDISGFCCEGSIMESLMCPFGGGGEANRVSHTMSRPGPIPPSLVDACLQGGRELSRQASRRREQLVQRGMTFQRSNPGLHHFFGGGGLAGEARDKAERSRHQLAATRLMQQRMRAESQITPNTFLSFLETQGICVDEDAPHTSCDPDAVYRTIDGTCNNLGHPHWGRVNSPFLRAVNPKYGDGIHSIPVAASGRDLPSARLISSRLFFDAKSTSQVFNFLNMQFGQFIAHDLLKRVVETTDAGPINCCAAEGQSILPEPLLGDQCSPIAVPEDDPFYSKYGVRCLNFVRTATTTKCDNSLGPAEQMNTVTSYLDASNVYSSDPSTAFELRSKVAGRMKERLRGNEAFLPGEPRREDVCDVKNASTSCFLAGDSRLNLLPTLAMVHTLFLREHNRVADILSGLNPLWTDERIYQEARKCVIAELQHIVYQEWLPLNLGKDYVQHFEISPSGLSSRDYNSLVNPGVLNGFGAAAFRYLHTAIPPTFLTRSHDGVHHHNLSDHYLDPSILDRDPDSFNSVLTGSLQQNAAETDPHVTGEISNQLLRGRNPWGLDLVAIDIQRGRDHGLASYNDYRHLCGCKKAQNFDDLPPVISNDRILALQKIYESVDDIDLYTGGSLEGAVQGSVFGPTFQCLVSEQFYRSRIGDRFFYDIRGEKHSFSNKQLLELKKTSMARLICDNTDIPATQRSAFQLISPQNPVVRCEEIPSVNFKPWKKHLFDF